MKDLFMVYLLQSWLLILKPSDLLGDPFLLQIIFPLFRKQLYQNLTSFDIYTRRYFFDDLRLQNPSTSSSPTHRDFEINKQVVTLLPPTGEGLRVGVGVGRAPQIAFREGVGPTTLKMSVVRRWESVRRKGRDSVDP